MTTAAPPPRQPVDAADLTARARIRDAAITRFAADGVAATTLKAIAADAGVSPPLVAHHFGSKDGLRAACDEHVAARIRAGKHATLTGGLDPLSGLRQIGEGPPLVRYLARTLADGSEHVRVLLDELVDDAVEYMERGVEHGLLKPTDRPRERAAVMILWQFGALVLHAHVERLVGADLMSDDPADFASWALAAGEILTHGVITETLFEQLRQAAETLASERDTKGRQR
jgi:AcrR family transcriptional regulator